MSTIRGHGRALLLIGLGLAIVAASALHVLAPSGQPTPVRANAGTGTGPARTPPIRLAQRPYGILHIDDVYVAAPEMRPFETDFVETLLTHGFTVTEVESSQWDAQLDQAHADIVRTNLGDLTVVAPDGPGHPLWLCPRSIAEVSGEDVPTYEVSAGGDRFTIQIEGVLYAGRVGDVLVLTGQLAVWQQLGPIVSPAACPG